VSGYSIKGGQLTREGSVGSFITTMPEVLLVLFNFPWVFEEPFFQVKD
jgi:hypothetical protein